MSEPLTILITGAGSGLGRGLAEHFLEAGHNVIGADLANTSQQLDVTSEASRKAIAALPVDVLINNAGLQYVAKLEDFSQTKWELLIDVMLNAPAALIRDVLPGMRTRGYGRIINIGSIHSLVASPFKSAYVAAKHGLLGLSKSIALETADVDITINTICPSYIRTPLVEAQIQAQAKVHNISEDEVIQRIMLAPMPKKKFITVEEVAAAIEYLTSHHARNITGQTITIDGGWTAQ